MRVVSSLLKRLVYPLVASTGYLRRHLANGPAVVTYHGVQPPDYRMVNPILDGALVTPESLRQQIRLLKSRYCVISPEQFRDSCQTKIPLPHGSVLLTCDDGLQNTLTTMVPLLIEEGVSCLFFVTGASTMDDPGMLWYEELYLMLLESRQSTLEVSEVGIDLGAGWRGNKRAVWLQLLELLSRQNSQSRGSLLETIRTRLGLTEDWNARFRDDPAYRERFFLLDRTSLLRLSTAGMAIGAHTLSHPMLAKQSDALAQQEISQSRSILEQTLDRNVWALAYPFGDPASVGSREFLIAESSGFECAFMNVGGGFGAEMPPFGIPRVHVTADMGLAEFEAHLAGFHRTLKQRFRPAAQAGTSHSQEARA